MKIKSNRLILSKPIESEIFLIQQIWLDEKTMADVGGIVHLTDKEMKKWFDRISISKTDEYFLIFLSDNQCIGEVSMHRFNKEKAEGELNIKILHSFRGKGYAYEVLNLFTDYLFNSHNVQSLIDEVYSNNKGASYLLEKCGFTIISQKSETTIYQLKKTK